jgi:hypothetical protein
MDAPARVKLRACRRTGPALDQGTADGAPLRDGVGGGLALDGGEVDEHGGLTTPLNEMSDERVLPAVVKRAQEEPVGRVLPAAHGHGPAVMNVEATSAGRQR